MLWFSQYEKDTYPNKKESSCQSFSNGKKLSVGLPQLAVLLFLWVHSRKEKSFFFPFLKQELFSKDNRV